MMRKRTASIGWVGGCGERFRGVALRPWGDGLDRHVGRCHRREELIVVTAHLGSHDHDASTDPHDLGQGADRSARLIAQHRRMHIDTREKLRLAGFLSVGDVSGACGDVVSQAHDHAAIDIAGRVEMVRLCDDGRVGYAVFVVLDTDVSIERHVWSLAGERRLSNGLMVRQQQRCAENQCSDDGEHGKEHVEPPTAMDPRDKR